MARAVIDGREIVFAEGEKILWAALREGIYIPHLCALEGMDLPFGGCRLCLVEIGPGEGARVTAACSEPLREGLVVRTDSARIAALRRMAFELIMTTHEIDCKNCAGRKKCALIKTAAFLKLRLEPSRFRSVLRQRPVDDSHALFVFDGKKCVNCGRCVVTCEKRGKSFLTFAGRGFATEVATFDGLPLAEVCGEACRECVEVCPTGALFFKEKKREKPEAKGPDSKAVAQAGEL